MIKKPTKIFFKWMPFFVILVGFLIGNYAEASISQTIKTDSITRNAGGYIGQGLGTGLSGTITDITMSGSAAANSAGYIYIWENNTAVWDSAEIYKVYTGNINFTTAQTDITTANVNYTLNPNKYYFIWFANPNQNFTAYGTPNNLYANGNCRQDWTDGCSSVLDLYFIVNGIGAAPSLTVSSPIYSPNYNPLIFSGSTTNAFRLKISYGNTTPTANTNIYDTGVVLSGAEYPWNFNYVMPTGYRWIKHEAIGDSGSTIQYNYLYIVNSTSTYNYFINSTTSPAFNLISTSTFYCDNLPNIFYTTSTCNAASSTIIYKSIVNFAGTVLSPALDWIGGFSGYFTTDKADQYASTTAGAIINVWAYGNTINQIFPNFPLFEILILLILVNIAILVFKAAWYLIKVIR